MGTQGQGQVARHAAQKAAEHGQRLPRQTLRVVLRVLQDIRGVGERRARLAMHLRQGVIEREQTRPAEHPLGRDMAMLGLELLHHGELFGRLRRQAHMPAFARERRPAPLGAW